MKYIQQIKTIPSGVPGYSLVATCVYWSEVVGMVKSHHGYTLLDCFKCSLDVQRHCVHLMFKLARVVTVPGRCVRGGWAVSCQSKEATDL